MTLRQSGVTINLYQETNASRVAGRQRRRYARRHDDDREQRHLQLHRSPAAGTYYVQESVPSGYIQTGGGPNGSAGNTYYTINATAGHSYTGEQLRRLPDPQLLPVHGLLQGDTPSGTSRP